jgi:NADH-quinone oxidoreductase subunit J
MESLVLYVFKYFIYFSTFLVSTVRNPTYSVLSLILVFLGGACLFLSQGAEFLGFMLVVVYVGAVAVLFLFVVMMLGVTTGAESIFYFVLDRNRFFFYFVSLLLFVLAFVYVFYAALGDYTTSSAAAASEVLAPAQWTALWDAQPNIKALGDLTYLYYFPAFLVCGVILLAAMVGSILLTYHGDRVLKRQVVFEQVSRPAQLSLHR